MAAEEDYLSDPIPANICVWTDGSILTNFGPVGTGVIFYATFARTQDHFTSPRVQFHPALLQRSQSSIMPLDGASGITPLAHSCPWLSLQTLPLTSLPRMLCGQSGPLSLLI